MPRAPLAALVTRWAMQATRAGVDVPPRVVVLLAVLAERMNQRTGVARPGYRTLMLDTGWSEDAIRDAGREATRLGALEVRTFRGRGLAAEFTFTDAVYNAPNLDAFADSDREKTSPAGNLSRGINPASEQPFRLEKGGSPAGEKVAGSNGKGGPPATPTVSTTVRATERTNERPSYPPAAAGGNGRPAVSDLTDDEMGELLKAAEAERVEAERNLRKVQRRQQRELAASMIAYVIERGGRAPRPVRRRLNDWASAGHTADEIQRAIDQGQHLPPVKW